MYLAPWQVFAGGCVVGTLIALIVLTTIVIRIIGKLGIGGVRISSSEDSEHRDSVDLTAKLSYILLQRDLISDKDIEFISGKIDAEAWREALDKEMEAEDDTEKED